MYVINLIEQTLGEVADRIPDGKPTDKDNGDEDHNDVLGVDADGIGVNDESTTAGAKLYEAEGLL